MITITQLWHVLVAGFAGYIVGGLWYSPTLFMKPWMRGVHKTEADLLARKKEQPHVMIYSFILSVVVAFGLSTFFVAFGVHTILEALQLALLIAFTFVITTKFTEMLYVSREPHWSRIPQQLFLVETGYTVASFSVMAVVLALLK